MAKRKIPEIRVVFDSNVLYTKVASDLFNNAIVDLIKNESDRADIKISWYLPDVVIKERQYQMQKAASELLPSIEKLERLLGHNLGITSDILRGRIEECISEHIKEYKIQVLQLDESKIDLKHVIHRSCYRLLPFSSGDNEKGFRDAMIAETFFQFIDISPKSTANCKIIFVTQDNDFKKHIEDETKQKKNVMVILKTDELIGLINTLASEVDESTIKQYQVLAEVFFFDNKNKAGLFYKEKIRDVISERYKSELLLCPSGKDLKRENATWYISRPQFVKKNRMRVSWSSRIEVTCQIYKDEITQPSSIYQADNNQHSNIGLLSLSNLLLNNNEPIKSIPPVNSSGLLSLLTPQKKIISKGKTIFDVRWSVNIGLNKKLTRATIEDISYIDTIWEEV